MTLLYDYQSINAIVDYLNTAVSTAPEEAPEEGSSVDSEEEGRGSAGSGSPRGPPRAAPPKRGGAGAGAAAAEKPSDLLKLLRGPPAQRPLFLAAPGVANAQAAYFSFSQYLAWSTQPIYVLDKDNDLTVADLARRNAADIVRVQPEGPYLLGGHSYGGCVAMEIAMVLESWGLEVGLVLVGVGRGIGVDLGSGGLVSLGKGADWSALKCWIGLDGRGGLVCKGQAGLVCRHHWDVQCWNQKIAM